MPDVTWVVRSDVSVRPGWLELDPHIISWFYGPHRVTETPENARRFHSRMIATEFAHAWSDFPGVWRTVARVKAPSRRVP